MGFYMPQSRAWELIFGGWMASAVRPLQPVRRKWLIECIPLVGLAMIGGAAIFLSKQTPYPGFYALLPVLGAGAVLWPLGRNTLVSRVLASKFLVFIGAISYSLYLFHWPIIVFWRHYISFAPLTTGEQVAIIALSFLVSWASWRFVEQRYRWRAASRRIVFTSAAAAVFLLAGVNIAIFASSGIPQRIPDSVKAISSREIMWDWTCPHEVLFSEKKECVVGHNWKDARFHIALWGDSNAAHILPILDRALAGRDA
jgi:peptidoglycan/LPS O-acetylase OafA/YrhL